jgi:hypothetical protein
MADVMTGILDDIVTRQPKPGFTVYDLVVDGMKFGHGPAKVSGVSKGDRIQFEVEERGPYKNVRVGTLKKWEGKGEPEPNVMRVVQTASPVSRDDYWKQKEVRDIEREKRYDKREEEKQRRITFEAARKQAMEYVSLLAQTESLWLKKVDKPADRQSYIEALVNDLTRKFYTQSEKREDFLGNKPLFDEDLTIEQPGDKWE